MHHALRREYAYYSWEHEFPDEIEQVLEDDYVENKFMYSEITLTDVQMLLLLNPNASPQDVLVWIRDFYEARNTATCPEGTSPSLGSKS
jgi:hypothetical protein